MFHTKCCLYSRANCCIQRHIRSVHAVWSREPMSLLFSRVVVVLVQFKHLVQHLAPARLLIVAVWLSAYIVPSLTYGYLKGRRYLWIAPFTSLARLWHKPTCSTAVDLVNMLLQRRRRKSYSLPNFFDLYPVRHACLSGCAEVPQLLGFSV